MSNVVVQKYGGTCVGSLERIRIVAKRVADDQAGGRQLVVVVSAMAGETDRFLKMAKEVAVNPAPREMDALLATGEKMSAALLSMSLSDMGVQSVSLDGSQVPIRAERKFGNARIQYIAPQKIQRHLNERKIVVVTGFQGVTEDGETVTLGRGGSDLTAVALAAALEATVCEIYTDVAGVFTADPNVCVDAKPIRELDYDEMLELANLGARVMQARSAKLAKRYQVPLHILCPFEKGHGTFIREGVEPMEGTVVSAVTCDRNEATISVRRLDGSARSTSTLFSALADAEINVDVIVQDRSADGKVNVTFTLPRDSFEAGQKIAEQISRSCEGAQVVAQEKVAKVSAVGLGMKHHSGVASQMFRALANENIEIAAVSTSDIKISCVVDDRYAELAVRSLHDEFGLAKEPN